MSLKISIGSDHAGFDLKEHLIELLNTLGHEVADKGTYSLDSTDYPDYAHPVAESVENNTADLGVLICGSANGVSMTANKHAGVRAAIAWLPEIASLARQHNNANVVCIPARFLSQEMADDILKTFLDTKFEGGRHGRRVDKIAAC
jgi:ribose 5-phosphate isomerase B